VDTPPDITGNLADRADPAKQQAALQQVYMDLLVIARAELSRHRRGETLNTRALVNEAYLKLFGSAGTDFASRRHFFATAAKAMRQVVIDHARARQAQCRGSGEACLSLDDLLANQISVEAQAESLVRVDVALARLATLDPRLVEVVELRFFAGLDVEEVARLLGVSEPTVKRDTRTAKAFLARELGEA
jgi:RNA polymerase sigma factor (TIGR02999 family)